MAVKNGTAADPKDIDVETMRRGKPFRTKLVPYGSAKLHLAQFPTAKLEDEAEGRRTTLDAWSAHLV